MSGVLFRIGVHVLRFPREVISVAVRCYLRYGLSYRDVEPVSFWWVGGDVEVVASLSA